MGEQENVLERVSALEEQVKGIPQLFAKLDAMYNLIVELKVEVAQNKSSFATKDDLRLHRQEVDVKLEKAEFGRKKLFWAATSSGIIFVCWLIEQLLHVTVKIGG